MKTSDHLAAAADQIAVLLRHGQRDLTDAREAITVLAARDRAVTALTDALRVVLARLDAAGHTQAVDAGHDVVRALTACADVSTRFSLDTTPTSRAAQAWRSAAQQIEAATAQALHVEPATPRDLRAAAADLAALAGTLPTLDADLATALTDIPALAEAGTAIAAATPQHLWRQARTAMNILDAAGPPEHYHLIPATGVAAVTSPDLIPPAIHRVGILLGQGPSLTGPQHLHVAVQLARLAHHLRLNLEKTPDGIEPALDTALRRFARANLGLAHIWTTTHHLRNTRPGSWDAPAQLQAINQLLTTPSGRKIHPTDARETTSLLPAIARITHLRFNTSLAQGHWDASYHNGTPHLAWATLWPDYGLASRDEKPTATDRVSTTVHLTGHTIHDTWHDKDIPIHAYRLGDPTQDTPPGSTLGVKDLTRIHTTLKTTTTTARELHTTIGPPTTAPPTISTQPTTADHPLPHTTQQLPPSVIPIHRSTDLSHGLHQLTALLHTTTHLSPQHLQTITKTTANAARNASRALLTNNNHNNRAIVLTEHADLLTDIAHAAQRMVTTQRSNPHPLQQTQQIAHYLTTLQTTETRLPHAHARDVANAIPPLTTALADITQRMINTSAWLQPSSTTPATWEPAGRSPTTAAILERLAAAVTHSAQITARRPRTASSTRSSALLHQDDPARSQSHSTTNNPENPTHSTRTRRTAPQPPRPAPPCLPAPVPRAGPRR